MSINCATVCMPLPSGRSFLSLPAQEHELSLSQLKQHYPHGFILNGLSDNHAKQFVEAGGTIASCSYEAWITPTTFSPRPSLEKLYSRGQKRVQCHTLQADTAIEVYYELYAQSKRASTRSLEFLYRSHPTQSHQFYGAFDKKNHRILAMLSFSLSGNQAFLDILLRSTQATPGVMEYLIISVFESLRMEGIQKISLGEVPFLSTLEVQPESFSARSMFRCLQWYYKINSSWYAAKGLYRFKEKFSPDWAPVYWGFWPTFSFRDFLPICYHSQAIAASLGMPPLSSRLIEPVT